MFNKNFIDILAVNVNLENAEILEIGCGNGEDLKFIAEVYKPKKIIGVDKFLDLWWSTHATSGDKWAIETGDAIKLNFPDNHFDVVYSLATFEHISDITATLREIKRVLKPYGKFFTHFSPIWTSVIGHHYDFWVSQDKCRLIPPWGHLWMTREEMYEYICKKENEDEAQKACYQIYQSEIINRIPRSDFYKLVGNCGLWVRDFREVISFSRTAHFGDRGSDMNPEIAAQLRSNGYDLSEVAVSGFTILLEKYSTI